MSEVLSQAQPYIQLEEAMKSSSTTLKCNNDGKKINSQHETPAYANNQNQGQHVSKKQAFSILSPSSLRVTKAE